VAGFPPERRLPTLEYDFPSYGAHEILADKIVHGFGLGAAVAGLVWLLARLPHGTPRESVAAVTVYGIGLLGMLTASALYNFSRPGQWKARFRNLDHAMIFVMIAGSYTPFVLLAMRPALGVPICAFVWTVALVGTIIKLTSLGQRNILSLTLYLGMGWLVLAFLRPLVAVLPGGALWCLVLGGVVYSLGVVIHCLPRMRFHNVVWHAFVVVAAGLHLSAIAQILPAA
jgi:hemolysin III